MKWLKTSLILFWLNLQAKFAVPTSTWQAVRPPTSPCVVSPLLLRLSRKHIEVAWLWWLIPRQLHKHIEVYTNTTQPMHITMCSFWTPFNVIEKTQNYTKTNTQTCFSLASPHKHSLIKYVSQIQVHTDANEAIGASPIPATDLDHSENNVSDTYTCDRSLKWYILIHSESQPQYHLQAVITGSGSGYQGFYLAYFQNSC